MQFPFLFNLEKNVDAYLKESRKSNPDQKILTKQFNAAYAKALGSGAVYGAILGTAIVVPIRIVRSHRTTA